MDGLKRHSAPAGQKRKFQLRAVPSHDYTYITKINVSLALEVAHRHAPRLAECNVLVTLAVLLHLGRVGGVLV